MRYIKTLSSILRAEKQLVGERAADLAILATKNFLVPLSFVITNEAFETFIKENSFQNKIAEALASGKPYDQIRELLLNGSFSDEMISEIVEGYESLGGETGTSLNELVESDETPFVSVSLSPIHTLPPEHREGIILHVSGLKELLLAIKECWACLFTPTMQQYRHEAGMGNTNICTGVIIQHMSKGDVTAEAWSATGMNTEELTVKSYLGTFDIGMDIEKDEFRLTREYLKPIYQSIAIQTVKLSLDEEYRLEKAPLGTRGEEQKLNDKLIIECGRLAKKASQVLDHPVWVIFNVQDEEVQTLLCDRLLLTKGSVKLQGYTDEERIDETPQDEMMTEERETAPDGRPEEGTEPEIDIRPETVVEEESALISVDDETGEEEVLVHEEKRETEGIITEEPDDEVREEQEDEVPEKTEEEAGSAESEEEPEPELEPEEEATGEEEAEPEEEKATEPETVSEQEPEEEPEPADESIFAGVQIEEREMKKEEVAEENALISVDDETGEEEVLVHEEKRETEAPVREEPTAEAEEQQTESDEQERDGEENDEQEEQQESLQRRTIGQARTEVIDALKLRYEARFRNQPPKNISDLFFELSSEIIIPHEELITQLITTTELSQDEEEEILNIIDAFLEEIR